MKHLISLIFLISLIVLSPGKTWGTTATPSPIIDQKAQDLLNRVATKVAQLSQVLQRSYFGTIKNSGSTTITIATAGGDKAIMTNDATSFFRVRSGNTTEINFAALKKSDDIAAIGTIDPTTSDLTAQQVIAKIQRFNFVGKITAVDKNILSLEELDKTIIKVDLYDAISLEKLASDSAKISKAKQSDFASGSAVAVIAYSPDASTGVFSVLKALIIPK